MQQNEEQELESKFIDLVAKLTTLAHTQTDTTILAHTQAHTVAYTTQITCTNVSTPSYTNIPTPANTTQTTYTNVSMPAYTVPTPVCTVSIPVCTVPIPVCTVPTPVCTVPIPAYTTYNTPTYTAAAVTLQQVEEIVRPLREENRLLKEQVAELSRRCDQLASQVTRLLAAPRISDQNVRRGWHDQANARIGAKNSRAKPKKSYGCAHEGCDWRNKKVTLQAYVLHLKRKHGENISDNPDQNLLPVLSR